jgi:hypothetical protein
VTKEKTKKKEKKTFSLVSLNSAQCPPKGHDYQGH